MRNHRKTPEPDEGKTAKQRMLPKVGSDLPIDEGLVGCTQALFFEYRYQTTSDILAPYCLKPYDHKHKGVLYKSMYLTYIGCDSEYEAAIVLLGNYAHWLKLRATTWFAPYLEEWNAELKLREEALAKTTLVELTEAGNVSAARTLLGSKKAPVGKPRKGKAHKDDTYQANVDDMLDRTESPKH